MNFDCLPTLIAQPYAHSIQESVQRKDYQYYTLEYALGLLSSITFACILHEYQMTQDTEESSATDQYKERVASIRTRLNADIGQMSMGKWMGIARDSTKLLKALSFSHPVTELLLPISDPKHIFHKSSNTLIKKRNDDMHGHPIPKDRLQKELDKRQELLEHVLSTFDFCAHVEFVYLEGYSITGGEVLYYGKKYQGVHPTAFQLKTNTNLPIKKLLLLYKKKDLLHHLDLSPMLVCTSVSDSEEEHCALYTKRTKNGKELGFVSLSGRSILELNNIQDTPLEDLEQRYTNLMYLLADPSKVLVESPEINASWLLPKMSNGEGREVHKTFDLELDIVNQSSKTAADSLTFVQELPFGFSIEGFDDEYREHIEVDHINRIIQLNIEQLNAKEKLLPKPKIQVQCSEQSI